METKRSEEPVEEQEEKVVDPSLELIANADSPEAVAQAISDIVADSTLSKPNRQFTRHDDTFLRLARKERILTKNYGVEKRDETRN